MPSRIRSLERHRADLPHLLHPSYLQSSTSSSGSPSSSAFSQSGKQQSKDAQLPSPAKVYVDSFGTMHDPDYQLFPRDEWRSLEESRRGEKRFRNAYGYSGRDSVFGGPTMRDRDGYELDEDDSEYDDEAHDEFWISSPSSSFSAPPPHHSHSQFQRTRRLTSSSYTSSGSSYSYSTPPTQSQYYSPTSSLVRTSTAATTTTPISPTAEYYYPRDEEIISALATPSTTHPPPRRRNVLYKHLPRRSSTSASASASATSEYPSTKGRRRRRLSRQKQRWYEDDASPFTQSSTSTPYEENEGEFEQGDEEGSVYSADDEHDLSATRRASLDSYHSTPSHQSHSHSHPHSHEYSIFSKRVPPSINTSLPTSSLGRDYISAPRSAIPASQMEMDFALADDDDEEGAGGEPVEGSHRYSMKRKWTALQLRVGFALFRTRRRLSRRLSLT
ncbi:hypothetical protein SISNIDRAFT_460864 [Sistotremastrum niveocremeum HHB9708]|uniref:Uncharacterized protein n=1 Tax=Sistotremastrum niveocremeum HHB9708 TaxID=1314777 RepID=A0A164N8U4_9AGAM|nr:hypothetical protein SISNIDRAFT_460864 [Sistotremastrum niveocremeum HHB9708]